MPIKREDSADTPLIGFNYQVELDGKRMVAFQTHCARDCTQEELDGVLDKLRRATDRQKKFVQIEACVTDIGLHEAQIMAVKAEIERNDAKYAERAARYEGRGERGMNAPEVEQRRSQVDSLENSAKMLEKLRARLAQLKSEVGEE